MALAYIGIGSNMGDRLANLKAAWHGMARLPNTVLLKNSSIYETPPVGGPAGQDDYYNAVSVLDTTLQQKELLSLLQALEKKLGRVREGSIRWGPRVIDLDILLWDDAVLEEKELIIPHPRLAERIFVLKPLADIDPDLTHPVLDLTIREMLERIDCDNEGIRRISV